MEPKQKKSKRRSRKRKMKEDKELEEWYEEMAELMLNDIEYYEEPARKKERKEKWNPSKRK